MSDSSFCQPTLNIFEYFRGKTQAAGLFEDRFGRIQRSFVVSVDGTVDEGNLTLDEHFIFDDGKKEHRVWRIQNRAGSYIGFADDIPSQARGKAEGNRFLWRYQMALRAGGIPIKFAFDDKMVLFSGGVMVSRARITKWGLHVGTVTIVFTKED